MRMRIAVVLIALFIQAPNYHPEQRYITVDDGLIKEMFDEHGIANMQIGVEGYDSHGNMQERCLMKVVYVNDSTYCWNGQH